MSAEHCFPVDIAAPGAIQAALHIRFWLDSSSDPEPPQDVLHLKGAAFPH